MPYAESKLGNRTHRTMAGLLGAAALALTLSGVAAPALASHVSAAGDDSVVYSTDDWNSTGS